MLGAVLLGRRALSIRAVALAALVILLLRPESLTGPGFQMSFAATGALVLAVPRRVADTAARWMRGWHGALVSLLLSSIVAGAATAPFAALHFNRLGQFGVLANLLAVPMMGMAGDAAAARGLLLLPLGLEAACPRGGGLGDRLDPGRARTGSRRCPARWARCMRPMWQVLPLLGLGMGAIAAGRPRRARGGPCGPRARRRALDRVLAPRRADLG